MIGTLDREGLLPAITFVFSRAGCDAAVKQCLRSSLRLTSDEERVRIAEIIDRRTADLNEADLVVLDYHEWREGLLRGLAAHHAGMLPIFRHTVEELFTAGLVKAVFATETLALGINMPARTVVLERLVKFNGEQHMPLTPGEYTQLTGRAGRRGIDVEGHAVVLWHPDVEPAEVAGLASTRTFPLRSSFAPIYNMTINLVNQMGPTQAHKLLESSFAQYQADRSVVGLVRGVERGERMLDEIAGELGGHDAPILDYVRLRAADLRTRTGPVPGVAAATAQGRQRCAGRAAPRRHHHHHARPPRRPGRGAGRRPRQRRPAAARADRTPLGGTHFVGRLLRRVGAAGLDAAAQAGRTPQPAGAPRSGVGAALRRGRTGRPIGRRASAAARRRSATSIPNWPGCVNNCAGIPRTTCRTAKPRPGWPSATCGSNGTTNRSGRRSPPRPTRWRARSIGSSCCSPSAGSSTANDGDPKVTDDGRLLARIYSESDLLVAECLRSGTWEGLDAAELAAVLSSVLYESRGDAPGAPDGTDVPTGKLRRALNQTRRLWTELRADEQRHRITQSREPDDGFVAAIYRWATTGDLTAALAASDASGTGTPLSAGDFVRWCRQVLDLLDQVRNAAPTPALRATAKRAINDIRRGVVAVDAG